MAASRIGRRLEESQVYLFGDQTYDISSGLAALLHRSHEPLLKAFLDGAYETLRTEVRKLPKTQQASFHSFTSVQDLLAIHRSGRLHPSLHGALVCIYQLASVISECAQSGGLFSHSNPCLIGLCTGSLAAATVSCCRTLSDLVPTAIHTVGVAFRAGWRAVEVGQSIEQAPDGAPLSWSLIISGLSPDGANQALDRFCRQHHLPPASQPYVSVTAEHSVTISGPPSVLRALRQSELSSFRVWESPVYAPFHTWRLFSKHDIAQILESTSTEHWSNRIACSPVLSSSSGKVVSARSYRDLLEVALEDILLRPIRWEDLVYGVSYFSHFSRDSHITLHPIGTNAEKALCAALKQQGYSPVISSESRPELQEFQSASFKTPSGRSKIAIVGMSGRFPEAEDLDAFWQLLFRGLDVHKTVPPSRWDVTTHVDPTGRRKNTSRTPYGCWLNNPGLFDAKFFNISPREAPQVDPASRIALMTTYEAMEQAGMVPGATPSTQPDRVGVFYGVSSNDWMEMNSSQDIDTYFIPGGCRAFVPGRINYCFKFSGQSCSVDTACSSSLSAIHIACNALWQGDVDTAIAGGTNVLTNPAYTAGLDRGHFLSQKGNCNTFDEMADGYCRGEAIATVILKRLEDAAADHDPILGVILGAYTNHSAESESITRPHCDIQRAVFTKILNDAGVNPYDVSYVEMHGTGTQAGDITEMNSVLQTFAPKAGATGRDDSQALYLGSVKANVGHGEGAAGATSLAKVLLMLKHDIIPPHCGIKSKINPRFPTDLEERKVFIPRKPVPWLKRPDHKPRRVFVNNFSAAGGNSAILLEDAPVAVTHDGTDPRSSHVVAVSAKCATSLRRNVQSLLSFLDRTPANHVSLPALSYTTTARRLHYPHRVVVSGSSLEEIKSKLSQALARGDGTVRPKSAPPVTFAFTGNGSQYPGMGKQLFENIPSFRSDLVHLDQIVQSHGYPSVLEFCSAAGDNLDGYSPFVIQVATICLEIALARFWISLGIVPHSVVGHSLGEYAALNIAGVLSDSDTIYLVARRAQLLQERCERGTHAMLAVGASPAAIAHRVKGRNYEISCINGPEDVVLSGKVDDIREIQATLARLKIKATLLAVPYAFHSSQVDVILDDFEKSARTLNFRKPTIPVICPLSAAVVEDSGFFGPKYLSDHCRKPVNMLEALRNAWDSRIISDRSQILEIGPQPFFTQMVKSVLNSSVTTLPCLKRKQDTWPIFASTLSGLYSTGANINWMEYHRGFEACQQVIQLPTYNWDLKDYWIQGEQAASPNTRTPIGGPDPVLPKLESPSIQRVVENTIQRGKGSIVVETDIGRSDVFAIAQGHRVDNIPLCTPAVYAEIALTLGTYILERYLPQKKNDSLIDISELTIKKALVPRGKGQTQVLRTWAEVDLGKGSVFCRFTSVAGQKSAEHSHCVIQLRDKSESLKEATSKVAAAKSRMTALRKGIEAGQSYRFNKPMIYRMVDSLAQFDPDYRGLDEIILDSSAMDASSVVCFSATKKKEDDGSGNGKFSLHPAFIDVLSQSAGFVMNANENSNLEQEVFVNHGWSSFRLYEQLSEAKKYETYVKMTAAENKEWRGDLIVLDGERPVASYKGITMQGVPRRLLRMILSQERNSQAAGHQHQASVETRPSLGSVSVNLANSRPEREFLKMRPSSPKADTVTQSVPIGRVESKPAATVSPNVMSAANDEIQPMKTPAAAVLIQRALQIISDESGVAVSDLTDPSAFADMGIDSLLTLLIASRLKEELDVEIEAATFADLPTIKHLKDFLERQLLERSKPTSMGERENILFDKEEEIVQRPFPEEEHFSDFDNHNDNSNHSLQTDDQTITINPEAGNPSQMEESSVASRAVQIIAEETGLSVADLTDDVEFASIGIDSLLSLMVVARCREELSIEMDDSSLLGSLPTVRDFKQFILGVAGNTLPGSKDDDLTVTSSASSSSSMVAASSTTWEDSSEYHFSFKKDDAAFSGSPTVVSEHEHKPSLLSLKKIEEHDNVKGSVQVRPATSVILQGQPRTAAKTLILFPDGSGSATSYANLPRVRSDLAIIALNCPYYRHPEEMHSIDLDELIESYLTELRRRQPFGPYNLGGWSSGGILAYRAAQRLIQEGEEVDSLALIDAPPPLAGLDKLPRRWYDHCAAAGIFGSFLPSAPSDKSLTSLVSHFEANMDVLHTYHAEPLPEGFTPRTSILWAGECVFDGVRFPKFPLRPGDPEGIKFLVEKRSDFSAGDWATLFPGERVVTEVMDGANHFTMMHRENSARLAAFLDRATR